MCNEYLSQLIEIKSGAATTIDSISLEDAEKGEYEILTINGKLWAKPLDNSSNFE